MQRLLQSPDVVLDVEDAGTTMRFLTAYCSVAGHHKILTGTERMKRRPIKILVDALRTLGAEINYLEEDGFPPLETLGFKSSSISELSIRGDVSSQYISALMMIAPELPQGLSLNLEGNVGSRPYIEMTASLMRLFGARVVVQDNRIEIPHQPYKPCRYAIEADWSAASYWYAFAALAQQAEIILPNMTIRSLQGDRVVVDIMEQLGVITQPRGSDLVLLKAEPRAEITWDFTHCPDLAQTVSVVCAACNVVGHFTGLESLRIKETDRIHALQVELKKLNAQLIESGSEWTLLPAHQIPDNIPTINTYLDHRMAMAFAPLGTLRDLSIEDPMVVRKSYPTFWKDMQAIGFRLTESEVD